MNSEDQDGIAYWEEINKLANFMIIDNNITKDCSDRQKEFTKVFPQPWKLLYDNIWIENILKSMWVIHFTDNLKAGVFTGLKFAEQASENDMKIPNSMAIAAGCMGLDIISKMVDILAAEGADINMEIVTDG